MDNVCVSEQENFYNLWYSDEPLCKYIVTVFVPKQVKVYNYKVWIL